MLECLEYLALHVPGQHGQLCSRGLAMAASLISAIQHALQRAAAANYDRYLPGLGPWSVTADFQVTPWSLRKLLVPTCCCMFCSKGWESVPGIINRSPSAPQRARDECMQLCRSFVSD